jgi:hypothetical protein
VVQALELGVVLGQRLTVSVDGVVMDGDKEGEMLTPRSSTRSALPWARRTTSRSS